jgi:transcriptional regulator with XRE-family HTH domain
MAMSVKNNFSRLLKSLRMNSDTAWTQESIAEALGIKRRTYIGWENGENIPSPEYLKQIVTLLKLNKEDEEALYRAADKTISGGRWHSSGQPTRQYQWAGSTISIGNTPLRMRFPCSLVSWTSCRNWMASTCSGTMRRRSNMLK